MLVRWGNNKGNSCFGMSIAVLICKWGHCFSWSVPCCRCFSFALNSTMCVNIYLGDETIDYALLDVSKQALGSVSVDGSLNKLDRVVFWLLFFLLGIFVFLRFGEEGRQLSEYGVVFLANQRKYEAIGRSRRRAGSSRDFDFVFVQIVEIHFVEMNQSRTVGTRVAVEDDDNAFLDNNPTPSYEPLSLAVTYEMMKKKEKKELDPESTGAVKDLKPSVVVQFVRRWRTRCGDRRLSIQCWLSRRWHRTVVVCRGGRGRRSLRWHRGNKNSRRRGRCRRWSRERHWFRVDISVWNLRWMIIRGRCSPRSAGLRGWWLLRRGFRGCCFVKRRLHVFGDSVYERVLWYWWWQRFQCRNC